MPSYAYAPTAQVVAAASTFWRDPPFLELYNVDPVNSDRHMPVLRNVGVPDYIKCLSWSKSFEGAEELDGIGGGLADGSLCFWNPSKLGSLVTIQMSKSLLQSTIIQELTTALWGIGVQSFDSELFSFWGHRRALKVWDLTTRFTRTDFIFRADLEGAHDQSCREISYVSWSRKMQNIVAATSYSGTCDFSDLRRAKPVIRFPDYNSRRCYSTFQWNPEVATQLIVASDDYWSRSLQVWDLRNSVSPIKELVGHTRGVLAMALCPYDNSLLVTCSSDRRTLCWDTGSGEILCEVPASISMNNDVQWSPGTPGVLSTRSIDGKIGTYNIERFVSRQKAKIHGERVPVSQWRSLPSEVKNLIAVNLPFTDQLSFKQVSRSSKREIEAVIKVLILTAVHFFIEEGKEEWQCAAFDLVGERWRRVPVSPYLPKLDPSYP